MNKRHILIVVAVCMLATQFLLSDVWDEMAGYQYGDSPNPVDQVDKLLQEASVDKYPAFEKKLVAIVASADATKPAKAFACRFLQRIGSPECIDAVSKLFSDDMLAHYAVLVLQQLQCEKADQAMRDALKGASSKTKAMLLGSLGERGDKKVVDLACRYATSEDAAIAKAALLTLGRIGGKAAASCLGTLKPAQSCTTQFLQAKIACAATLSGDKAISLLRSVFESNNTACRIASLKELLRVDFENSFPLFVKALKSRNETMARGARSLVAASKGKKMTEALVGLLDKLSGTEKAGLIVALGLRGDRAALPPLLEHLKSNEKAISAAAAKTVSRLADAASVSYLLRMAGDKISVDTVVETVAAMSADGVDRAVMKALENNATVATAMKVIAARNCSEAVPAILNLTGSTSAELRKEAWKAVADLAREQDAERIIKAAVDLTDPEELALAERAVKTVCERAGDKKACFREMAASYAEAPKGLKQVLIAAGSDVGSTEALKLVKKALDSGDDVLHIAAVAALCSWPNETAAEPLLKLAKNAAEKADQKKTLEGYIRIAGLPDAALTGAQRTEMLKTAMELAGTIEEKKMVIEQLRTAVSLEALSLLKTYMNERALKPAAEISAAHLIWNMRTAYPVEAEQMAKKLGNSREPEASRKAMETLTDLRKTKSYVRGWLRSDLYPHKDFDHLFDTALPPEKDPSKGNWRNLLKGIQSESINLEAATGTTARCCIYLKTTLIAPEKQTVNLELGSDDAIKVWLNGKLVHQNRVFRGCRPAQDKVKVTLKKGANPLLLKIINGSGTWGASCRLRQDNGMPVEGLEVRP